MVKQEYIHRWEHYTSGHRVTGQDNLMYSEAMGSAPGAGRWNQHPLKRTNEDRGGEERGRVQASNSSDRYVFEHFECQLLWLEYCVLSPHFYPYKNFIKQMTSHFTYNVNKLKLNNLVKVTVQINHWGRIQTKDLFKGYVLYSYLTLQVGVHISRLVTRAVLHGWKWTQTLDSTTTESQSKQLSQVKLAPLVELDLTCSLFFCDFSSFHGPENTMFDAKGGKQLNSSTQLQDRWATKINSTARYASKCNKFQVHVGDS